jgi:hypothetical protein
LSLEEWTATTGPFNGLKPDLSYAVPPDTELIRCCSRKVNDPAPPEGTAVIDPHHDGLTGIEGRHLHGCAEGQAAMGGHQFLR